MRISPILFSMPIVVDRSMGVTLLNYAFMKKLPSILSACYVTTSTFCILSSYLRIRYAISINCNRA